MAKANTRSKHRERRKACKIPILGSSWSVVMDARGRNVVWFGSWGSVLLSSPGQGLVIAGLFAPEMFWRVKLGWAGIYEQSPGDGLCLRGAVRAKSIIPFHSFLLRGLPPSLPLFFLSQTKFCMCPASALVSPQLLCLSSPGEEMPLGMELMGAPVQHPITHTSNPGTGAGPPHVLLHVFKEFLSHPTHPMGHLCGVSFYLLGIYLHLVMGHQNLAP